LSCGLLPSKQPRGQGGAGVPHSFVLESLPFPLPGPELKPCSPFDPIYALNYPEHHMIPLHQYINHCCILPCSILLCIPHTTWRSHAWSLLRRISSYLELDPFTAGRRLGKRRVVSNQPRPGQLFTRTTSSDCFPRRVCTFGVFEWLLEEYRNDHTLYIHHTDLIATYNIPRLHIKL
jgi:hypothetical protein